MMVWILTVLLCATLFSSRPGESEPHDVKTLLTRDGRWMQFFAAQQDLISQHRRGESLNADLGILTAASVAFALFASEHLSGTFAHVASVGVAVGLAAIASLGLMFAVVVLGTETGTLVGREREAFRTDEGGALDAAIGDMVQAYTRNRVRQRHRQRFHRVAFALMVAALLAYLVGSLLR